MGIRVLVVDDRVLSAQALVATKALQGCDVTTAASWAEASDTLTYQQLARSELPTLLVGPLTKDAIDSLSVLRSQGIDLATALYTENRSQDQDQTLITQYRLRCILHKPFSSDDRQRLLGGAAPERAARSSVTSPVPRLGEEVPLPEVGATPPLRTRMKTPPMGSGTPSTVDDLTGSTRSSSVRAELPPKRAATDGELPTGVQKLLMDPTGAGAAPAPSASLSPEPAARSSAGAARPPTQAVDPDAKKRLSEPRSITVLIIDDRFGTASMLVERVGAPGQRCHIAPSYQEALPILERFMSSSMGCELVVGPLSADGVAAVREYRKRNWGNHVVFYTESATQSQDARLPLQYGCMTILRRAGMAEPLEGLIVELRHHNRQAPALPQEHVRSGTTRTTASSATTTSGLHPAPGAPPSASAQTGDTHKMHDSRVAPPSGVGSTPQRIRRSVLPPAAPATPTAHRDAPLSIDSPSTARHSSRVITCTACRQEFVVTASGNLPVRCSHCQALNQLK